MEASLLFSFYLSLPKTNAKKLTEKKIPAENEEDIL